MRWIVIMVAIAVSGIAIGGASAWYSIQRSHGIGAIRIGIWLAIPFAGADEIDPYTVAKSVAEGSVPLGIAEGLAFETITDSSGEQLDLACDYRIEGRTPAARLWTLVAYGEDGTLLDAAPGGRAALHSGVILRFADGSFLISVSDRPKPGNWMALRGDGPFRLVLRLYDTPITGGATAPDVTMPEIRRGACRR